MSQSLSSSFPKGIDFPEGFSKIYSGKKNQIGTLVRLCLNVLNKHDQWWRRELAEFFISVDSKKNPELYFRIKQQCMKNGMLPIVEEPDTTSILSRYQTYNLVPCRLEPAKHGGSLISVTVNPDFDANDSDLNCHRWDEYEIKLAGYEEKMIEYHREMEKYHDEIRNLQSEWDWILIRSPMRPFRPFPSGYNYHQDKDYYIKKRFPTYSENIEAPDDPQGDINWMLYLPQELRTFFGFSKRDGIYTFPDIDAINSAIQEFNRLAASKGYGENYIPLTVTTVKGQISDREYLKLIKKNLLPISEPKSYSSWAYHDLLYHVIGLLLTPRDVLVKGLGIARLYRKNSYSKLTQQRIVEAFDHLTTWAIRIRGIEYERSVPSLDFYGFSLTSPLGYMCTLDIIVEFNALGIFGSGSAGELQLLKDMGKEDYYNDLRAMIRKLDCSMLFKMLTAQVQEHVKNMISVISD